MIINYLIIGLLILVLIMLIALLLTKGNHSNNNDKEINEFKDKVVQQLNDSKVESIRSSSELKSEISQSMAQFKNDLKEEMHNINYRINNNIVSLNEKVENRLKGGFSETNKTFEDIKERMIKIDSAQKNIESLSTKVVSLQNVLTNNQARGQFGEYQLNQLLRSLFGEEGKLYSLQYTLSNKTRVDACVFLEPPFNLVGIDSKFAYSSFANIIENNLSEEEERKALQSLRNDLKIHIKDVSSKYIIDGETAPFAWMFIPSDALLSIVHYKLPEIISYANSLKVSIVSPTLLLPLLTSYHTLNISVKQAKNAEIIHQELLALDKEVKGLSERWEKLHNNINTLVNNANDVNIKVHKIDKRFNEIKNNDQFNE